MIGILIPAAFLIAGIPWLFVFGRLGHFVAVPAAAAGTVLVAFAVLVATRFSGTDITSTELVGAALVAFGGLLVMLRRRSTLVRPGRHALALWIPALAGAVGWFATIAVSQAIPGAARLSWAMNGDTFNNLFYARRILRVGGVALGPLENPVPLPASILALVMAPGRPSGSAGALLERDLGDVTITWMLLLAATAVAVGAVVGSAIASHRTVAVAVASGLGSLLPLTWWVGGLPVQWGYMNVHAVLPLVLASWLVFLNSKRKPAPAVIVLLVMATLILTNWAPLVVFPVAFLAVIVVRNRVILRAVAGLEAALVAIAFLLFFAWLGGMTLLTYFYQEGALQAAGHGYPVSWPAVLVLAVAVLVAAISLRRRIRPLLSGVIAILISIAALSAVLVYIARGQADPWGSYYPVKAAWLITVVLGAILLSLLLAAISRTNSRMTIVFMAVTVVIFLTISAAVPVDTARATAFRQPPVRILSGTVWHTGDAAARQIIEFLRPGSAGLLWKSNDPDEAIIDFWVMVYSGGDLTGDEGLRGDAFGLYTSYRATGTYDDSDPAVLCDALGRMNPVPVIHTADSGLAAELATACPESRAIVVVDR